MNENEEELEMMKNQLKEERVLLSQVDDVVNEKLNSRIFRRKLKKDHFEEIGVNVAMYMRKLMDRLVEKGDLEGALMASSLNKYIAVELEDIWTNYLLQIDLARKDPYRDLIK